SVDRAPGGVWAFWTEINRALADPILVGNWHRYDGEFLHHRILPMLRLGSDRVRLVTQQVELRIPETRPFDEDRLLDATRAQAHTMQEHGLRRNGLCCEGRGRRRQLPQVPCHGLPTQKGQGRTDAAYSLSEPLSTRIRGHHKRGAFAPKAADDPPPGSGPFTLHPRVY